MNDKVTNKDGTMDVIGTLTNAELAYKAGYVQPQKEESKYDMSIIFDNATFLIGMVVLNIIGTIVGLCSGQFNFFGNLIICGVIWIVCYFLYCIIKYISRNSKIKSENKKNKI